MQQTSLRRVIAIFVVLLLCGLPRWSHANETSDQLVSDGRAQLFNGGSLTVSGLLAARETLAGAIEADATDQTAQAFYGFTHALAFLFEDGTTAEIDTLKAFFEAFGAVRTENDGVDMPLFSDLPLHDGEYDPPADLPDGQAVRAFVQGPLLARLDQVIAALGRIESGFTVAITSEETGGEALAVDYADIQVLRAWANAVRTFALVVSAYDLPCDLNDVVQLLNADMLQLQRDLLEPDDAFLALRSEDGDAMLLAAAQALQAATSDYRGAHDYIVDRIINHADWRMDHLFFFDSLAEANTSAFVLNRLEEIQASISENRPATFTAIEQTWLLTDDTSGQRVRIEIEMDPDGNLEFGEWYGLDGCTFVACGGTVQDIDILDSAIAFVLSADDGCVTTATFNGTLGGNIITAGTYTTSGCSGTITGSFTGSMTETETLTDVVDCNRIFGTNGAPPLDIRAVLPDFNTYNKPFIGSFPPEDDISAILNGILPTEPQIITNEDATRQFDLMPTGEFTIPTVSNDSILIDGTFGDWPVSAKVFDDIRQDDPEESYNGNEDLKSFWMAQDDNYYYMRVVYHDGPAPEGANTEIIFNAVEVPEQFPIHYKQFNVLPYSGEGGTIYIYADSYSHYSGSAYVSSGLDGSDACVEWRIPRGDLGDLSGRFIDLNAALNHNDGSNTYKDINPTFVQFAGYTITGAVSVDGYTGGNILLYLYDSPDPEYGNLIASTMIDAEGTFTIAGLPNMDETTCYLFALWDQDGNGIVSAGDVYGVTTVTITDNVTLPDLGVTQLLDFNLMGSVMNVHQPDGTFATYLDLYISGFTTGILPDDLDSVVFEGPSGVLATLDSPDVSVDLYSNDECEVFIALPGQPALGDYTFTVTSGSAVRMATDSQTLIREIPLPDETSFYPQPGMVVDSATPVFSWDPVVYEDVPLYYRLQIQDASGNLVVNTSRTQGMTSYTVPAGTLLEGRSYTWRVRVTDSGDWIAVENRSHSAWQPFSMASALASPAMPAVDLDNWGVVMYRTSDYSGFDLMVRVIDHDGVSFNDQTGTASHSVIAYSPAGDVIPLNYDYSENSTSGYFYRWFQPEVADLAPYEGNWAFVVTDLSGNSASVVDVLDIVELPFPDAATFYPADGTTVANTTPTFTWGSITGENADQIKRARVRIFTEDLSSTVWRGYVGLDTSYTVPPGVLSPDTTYRYRIDVYDAHSAFDVDNVSRAPASGQEFPRFTTGPESPNPYIDLDSTGVETWSGSSFGPTLSFWVRVFDPQGVPGDIESVTAILPDDGGEVHLRYRYNANATSAYYSADTFAPIASGDYILRVEDREGNSYATTETLESDPIGLPDPGTFLPLRSTLINTTAVDFQWADVDGAAFYRVEIYDENFDRIYRFATTENQFSLPEGFLAENTYYAYRITTRREFFDQNVDNGSSSPWFSEQRFNFVTTAAPGGAVPEIATDNWGAVLWQYPRPDDPATSYYWMVFNVRVTDADGPPHAIQRVMVTFPDGTTTRTLSFDGQAGTDSAYYWYMEDIADPAEMPAGAYTFTVTDVNGNVASVTDDFVRNPLSPPTGLLPVMDTDVSGTTPTISWDPVDGAVVYRLEIYNEAGGRIHRPYLSATDYTVPDGILDLNTTYSYRVRAHREDPGATDLDNLSSSAWMYSYRPHFTTRPITDADDDGIPDAIETPHACLDAYDDDTDDDGLLDGVEDANRDGVHDAGETNPCVWDSDDDGMPDGWETDNGMDPLVGDAEDDPDGDLFTNYMEYLSGSDPGDSADYPSLGNGFDADLDVDGVDLYRLVDGVVRGLIGPVEMGDFTEGYGR